VVFIRVSLASGVVCGKWFADTLKPSASDIFPFFLMKLDVADLHDGLCHFVNFAPSFILYPFLSPLTYIYFVVINTIDFVDIVYFISL
jgi:hypothetical protein